MLIHLHFSDETMVTLSQRAIEAVDGLDLPWRFAPRGDYDPDHNPSGLISFGTAENVGCSLLATLNTNVSSGLGDRPAQGIHGPKCMCSYTRESKASSTYKFRSLSHMRTFYTVVAMQGALASLLLWLPTSTST